MNLPLILALSLCVMLTSATMSPAVTLVDQLLAGYEKIQSLSCEVRRDAESRETKVKALSRVYFERPDKLHVENVTPLPRRIVADGTNFFSYVQGDPKGYSRPVSKLEGDMLISLRKVPGTAMDHLLHLRNLAETNLPATATFPVRKGYDTGKMFAVLSLDTSNRLTRIEFFTTAELKQKTAEANYGNFIEAIPGVWLSALHQTAIWMGGMENHETSRFDHLQVNQPIARDLFNASLFFKKIDFVSSFEEMYP
jgi:outer membrane lipoprotein-sorting protein